MPIYLDTRGQPTLSVGVCDRCKIKFPIGDLSPDRNSPGLMVCAKDNDLYDPWRLPARKTENITVRHPRPDTPLDGSTP